MNHFGQSDEDRVLVNPELAAEHWKAKCEKAEAACAEMRDMIPELWRCANDDCDLSQADIEHALSSDCGKGWVSPEHHQELVERWQKCQRDYAEMGDRLIAKLDLMKDEFHRIRACSDCPSEIRQIAHRAVMDIRQHVPVIDQRDRALGRLNDAQHKLTLAVEALKDTRKYNLGTPAGIPNEWFIRRDKIIADNEKGTP